MGIAVRLIVIDPLLSIYTSVHKKQYTIDFHTTVTKITISYPNLKQIFPPLIHENRNKFYCHIQ